jgi:hypothetical protein
MEPVEPAGCRRDRRRAPQIALPRLAAALLAATLATAAGCATPPPADPEAATAWGYVRLVPKVADAPTAGAYGSRRVADTQRDDYSHTTYAVVFAPGQREATGPPARFAIRNDASGLAIHPRFGASTRTRGALVVNETDEPRIVSVPSAGWMRRLEPGASAQIDGLASGETAVHLLGHEPARNVSLLWVAEGAFTEVDASGRYVLRSLEPGPQLLRAWHPRMPPTSGIEVELVRGAVERADLDVTVSIGADSDVEVGTQRSEEDAR